MMKKVITLILGLAVVLSCMACSQKKDTVEGVIEKLKAADLPISDYTIFDDNTDPNGSGDHAYIEKGIFFDDRIDWDYEEGDGSGSVEIFNSAEDAQKRADYINGFAALDTYRYQLISNNALIRLNTAMTHEQAKEYAEALDTEFYTEPTDAEYKAVHKIMDEYTRNPPDRIMYEICTKSKVLESQGHDPVRLKFLGAEPLSIGNYVSVNAETRKGTKISITYTDATLDEVAFINIFNHSNDKEYIQLVTTTLVLDRWNLSKEEIELLVEEGSYINNDYMIYLDQSGFDLIVN